MNRYPRVTRAYWLGRVGYQACWDLQRYLVDQVRAGETPSTLLLLEHEPVFSMGRRATLQHVHWDDPERDRRGVDLVWSDRGGDVTYHGPGQLTGYPILDLPALDTDIISYIRTLERSLIAYLGELGISAEPGGPGLTGVWSQGAKVAAIGVKLNQHVSNHGFALNVTNEPLAYFKGIVPCGLDDKAVTSIAGLGGPPLTVEAAARGYALHFAKQFACELEWRSATELQPVELLRRS
jgi:lipoyl(octanoyl) transferase